MPVPDYESLMLPLLQLCADGKPHSIADACAHYCGPFQVEQSDPNLHGRFGTAKNYLSQALLLAEPAKRTFQITPRGQTLLKTSPLKITRVVLQQYPEFAKARAAKPPAAPVKPATPPKPTAAPAKSAILFVPSAPTKQTSTSNDELAKAYKKHQSLLAEELAAQIKQVSPRFFEKLVVDLLLAMGYGCRAENAAQVVGQCGDGGIDGILHEDPLGLSVVYVQAKKRGGPACIGEVEVRNFVGALQRYQPCKGVFVTTGQFTDGAKAYVKTLSCKIALIDGEQLIKYMLEYGVGVSVRKTYQVKKMDTDYFTEE